MLDYKPQKLIKYWKYSKDDQNNNQVEIITNEGNYLALSNQYYLIWNLIDGFTTVKEIINFFEEAFKESSSEEVSLFVSNTLEEMEKNKLLVINWNPFG